MMSVAVVQALKFDDVSISRRVFTHQVDNEIQKNNEALTYPILTFVEAVYTNSSNVPIITLDFFMLLNC